MRLSRNQLNLLIEKYLFEQEAEEEENDEAAADELIDDEEVTGDEEEEVEEEEVEEEEVEEVEEEPEPEPAGPSIKSASFDINLSQGTLSEIINEETRAKIDIKNDKVDVKIVRNKKETNDVISQDDLIGIMWSGIIQLQKKTDSASRKQLTQMMDVFKKLLGKEGKKGEDYIKDSRTQQRLNHMKDKVISKYR
jgi:hypothetical protein